MSADPYRTPDVPALEVTTGIYPVVPDPAPAEIKFWEMVARDVIVKVDAWGSGTDRVKAVADHMLKARRERFGRV